MKKLILHYLWGLAAQCFNGVIQAICAEIGIGAGSLVIADVRPLNLHTLITIAASAFVLNAVFYFKMHPLPNDYLEETSFRTALDSVIKT